MMTSFFVRPEDSFLTSKTVRIVRRNHFARREICTDRALQNAGGGRTGQPMLVKKCVVVEWAELGFRFRLGFD